MITIRRATRADLEATCAAHRAAIEVTCRSHYSAQEIAAWAGPLKHSVYEPALRERQMLVAEVSGAVAGLGILDLRRASVDAVYVSPAHQGRGIGAQLLATLEGLARGHLIGRLRLIATLNGVGFYEQHGYRRLGETTHRVSDGIHLACVRMEKDL